MVDYLSQPPAELIKADFNIYRFTDQIYKIVHFKSTAPRLAPPVRKVETKYDDKLDASLSRSRRVVLELALCNDWEYFCTFTITKEKFNRSDLVAWHDKFSQWLRDQRKKYKKAGHDFKIDYVLVPEQHKDGSWHMHGLFSDISPVLIPFYCLRQQGVKVPDKLVNGGYLNWTDYQKKFGFCSFGRIKNKVASAFYVSKYISKQLQEECVDVGLHLYYPSRGLNRASFHGAVYGACAYLDQFCTNHYEFCSVGMTHVRDGITWNFAMEYMDVDLMEAFSYDDQPETAEVDRYYEAVQEVLPGF